jgi:hypothetical protein
MSASHSEVSGTRPEDVKARQNMFLEAFDKHGTIKHACMETKIRRETVARWKREDVFGFVDRFDDAKEDYAEIIENVVFERAKRADCNPILQIFVLKALKPDKYRDQPVITDDVAKDVMKDLRSKFKGIKFSDDDSPDKSAEQQAEDILRGKN